MVERGGSTSQGRREKTTSLTSSQHITAQHITTTSDNETRDKGHEMTGIHTRLFTLYYVLGTVFAKDPPHETLHNAFALHHKTHIPESKIQGRRGYSIAAVHISISVSISPSATASVRHYRTTVPSRLSLSSRRVTLLSAPPAPRLPLHFLPVHLATLATIASPLDRSFAVHHNAATATTSSSGSFDSNWKQRSGGTVGSVGLRRLFGRTRGYRVALFAHFLLPSADYGVPHGADKHEHQADNVKARN